MEDTPGDNSRRKRRPSLWEGENGNYKVGDDVWVTRDDELMFELAKVIITI